MIGIYKITSPSGKVYIGQSWNIENRWNDHKYAIRYSYHKTTKLNSSFIKYGVENHKFEICHELPVDVEQEVLDRYEQFYMDCYRDCGIELMNLKEGGSNGKISEETKIKIRNRHTGRVFSEESKQKMRINRKGIPVSQETRRKISQSKKGKPISEETRLKRLGNSNHKGHKHSDETKKRISESKRKIA